MKRGAKQTSRTRPVRKSASAGRVSRSKGRCPELTRRESQVLGLVAEGMTEGEIGLKLKLSRVTVRNHATLARNKLGCKSKLEMVSRALKLGLVKQPRG